MSKIESHRRRHVLKPASQLPKETLLKPRTERTEAYGLAFIAAWRRADPKTRKQILAILSGKIDIAIRVWLPPAQENEKAVTNVKP
jgi:hypothetical protein